jgi:hypothetical protein
MRRSFLSAVAILLGVYLIAQCGIGSHATAHMGGTVTSIPQATERTSSTDDEKVFVFQFKGVMNDNHISCRRRLK